MYHSCNANKSAGCKGIERSSRCLSFSFVLQRSVPNTSASLRQSEIRQRQSNFCVLATVGEDG